MKNIFEIVEDLKNNPMNDGIKTYIKSLDSVIKSFDKGELIGIFGRPGFGKTSLAITIAVNNIVQKNRKIAFFSTYNYLNVIHRFISAFFSIDLSAIQNLSFHEIKETYNLDFGNICFKVNTENLQSIQQIEEILKQEKFDLVIADDVGLLYDYSKHTFAYGIEFCKSLKNLALRFDVPIIVTGALNRSVVNRPGDKRPYITDIRDFHYIEIVADKVIFIHRPEFYGFSEDEEGNSTDDVVELLVLKNNRGDITSLQIKAFPLFSKFHDMKDDKDLKQNVVLKRVE